MLVDRRSHSLVLRIAYDGPPGAGKATNLRHLCERLALGPRGLVEPPGGHDRSSQFFDWLDVAGGWPGSEHIRCQLAAVPGQIELARRRRHILDTADAVIFVADSRAGSAPETAAALRSLARGLTERADIPLVLQANKQDLPGAQPQQQVHDALGLAARVPVVAAHAATGAGVLETFLLAVQLAVDHVRALLVAGELGDHDAAAARDLLDSFAADAPAAFDALVASATASGAATAAPTAGAATDLRTAVAVPREALTVVAPPAPSPADAEPADRPATDEPTRPIRVIRCQPVRTTTTAEARALIDAAMQAPQRLFSTGRTAPPPLNGTPIASIARAAQKPTAPPPGEPVDEATEAMTSEASTRPLRMNRFTPAKAILTRSLRPTPAQPPSARSGPIPIPIIAAPALPASATIHIAVAAGVPPTEVEPIIAPLAAPLAAPTIAPLGTDPGTLPAAIIAAPSRPRTASQVPLAASHGAQPGATSPPSGAPTTAASTSRIPILAGPADRSTTGPVPIVVPLGTDPGVAPGRPGAARAAGSSAAIETTAEPDSAAMIGAAVSGAALEAPVPPHPSADTLVAVVAVEAHNIEAITIEPIAIEAITIERPPVELPAPSTVAAALLAEAPAAFLGSDDDPTWEHPAVDPAPPAPLSASSLDSRVVDAIAREDEPTAPIEMAPQPPAPAAVVAHGDFRVRIKSQPMPALDDSAEAASGATVTAVETAPAAVADDFAEIRARMAAEIAATGAGGEPRMSDVPALQLPPVDLPAGMVWPGVSGRVALAAVAAPTRLAERAAPWAPLHAVELICAEGWSAHTSAELVFPDDEHGRQALADAVRWQGEVGPLTPPGRTYALAPVGDRVRLWVFTPAYRTMWATIEEAFARGDRATAARLARVGLEAVDELRARNVPIVDLDHIAVDDPPRLLSTPWTPPRDRLIVQLQRLFAAAVL